MTKDVRKLLLCNCNRTMPLDGKALAQALEGGSALHVNSELCRQHLASFEAAAKSGEEMVVACTQEATFFTELHGELKGKGGLRFVNIRETAGWSAEGSDATPKIAALLALANLPEAEPVPTVSYKSEGSLLIIGPADAALAWAERLSERLDVCVLFTDGLHAELPLERRYPVFSGKVSAITGYLGAFEVSWEQMNPIDLEVCTRCGACIDACPESAIDYAYQIDLDKCRAHRKCVAACGEVRAIDFERAERARSERFDLVLDLSAEPVIRLHQPPQGYFAPRRDPVEQALAASRLLEMVGEFEKPKYFEYREKMCAHGRSEIEGCRKCIDVCSTQAIASELEANRVRIEPHLCMGCGGCATVCPSGAMRYAYPRMPDMGARLKALLQTYRNAGGRDACLLLHDASDGRRLIGRLGRRGKGLPARVIPVEVFHIGALGPDLLLGGLALGAAQMAILATGAEAPEYRDALRREIGWAQDVLAALGYDGGRLELIEADEPERLETAIWGLQACSEFKAATFNFSDDKRTTLDFALDHLLRHAAVPQEEVALTAGAPYGRVAVNKETCTLCMACVGACPESALVDSKELPQLKFIERNCVQCGLCQKTCPEQAITLAPRLLLTPLAKSEVVLNEASVFACVKCGKPFGTKQMIDSMVARLASHSMFAEPQALERLKKCADCRVMDLMQNARHGSIFES